MVTGRLFMLTIVTDNLPEQINGVVRTYAEIAKIADEDIRFVHAGLFRGVQAPGYSDIKLCMPWGIGEYLSQARHIHIATEGPLGFAAVLWCIKNGRKYTSAYHTKFPEALVAWGIPIRLSRAYFSWFHRGAVTTLVTTESMRKELSWLGANMLVWARGVNGELFRRKEPEGGGGLLYVGRVSREKGIEDFLRLEGRKTVVGDGPLKEELQAKYAGVEWTGWLGGDKLADAYRAADVLVFPSRWDTFGLVMLEAIACGTPVAGYDVPGPIDVIEQGVTGWYDPGLGVAVEKALSLGRVKGGYSWDESWAIFKSITR